MFVGSGEEREGINWETGNETYTLPHIRQATNKDLLYSTGNPIQYSVIANMGKESKKEWMHVHDSLCYTAENNNIVNQLYTNKNF